MKIFRTGVFLLLLSGTLFAQDAVFKIEDLSWISGCWQSENKEKNSSVSEFWTKVAGGSMFGIGRTVKSGKTVDYEYLRIVQDEKGIFYIAKPRANAEETPFKLIKLAGTGAVFENPGHDFPQRIIYEVTNGAELFARVEGNNKGKPMGFDFKMSRTKCD
jgi:Domain of unknown function (DUF6265)